MAKKLLLRLFESLCILVIFAVIAAGATLYRLHQAPLNVNFALETIEESLANTDRQLETNVKQASLFWPDIDGPVLLLLDGVQVSQQGIDQFTLNRAVLSIARAPMFLGQIKPEVLILEGTTLRLVRSETNEVSVALDFGDKGSSDKDHKSKTSGVDPLVVLEAVLSKDPKNDPLLGLKALEIKEASISVDDQAQQKTWSIPDFSILFTRNQGALDLDISYMMKGQVQPTDIRYVLSKEKTSSSRGYNGSVTFQNLDVALMGKTLGLSDVEGRGLTLQGHGELSLSKSWDILTGNAKVEMSSGQVKIAGIHDDFLDIDHVKASVGYGVDSEKEQKFIDVHSFDVQANGVGLVADGRVTVSESKIDAPITIKGRPFDIDSIEALVPLSLAGRTEEKWMKERLADGKITSLNLKLPLSFDRNTEDSWDANIGDITADFAFENLTVDYRAPLKKAKGIDGVGSFKDDTLRIEGKTGYIGDLKTNKTTVVISDISVAGGGLADIDVHAEGPFSTLVDYLGDEPISLGDKLGFKSSEVKGNAVVDIQVDFPTVKGLKIDDVKVKAKAKLNDMYLPRVVKGMPLTGGPMNLVAQDGYFTLSGKGQLDKRAVELEFTQYLDLKKAPFSQKVEASLVADKKLRDVFGINLDDYISGDLPLSITYLEKTNGKAKIDVDANLTPLEFFIEPLNYQKPLGLEGHAKLTIFTEAESIREVSDLNITLHDGHVKNGRLVFAKINGDVDIQRGELPNIKLPDSVMSVNLEQTKENTLKVDIAGQKLDVRHFLSKDPLDTSEKDGQRTIVSGHVDQMKVSDEGAFHAAKLYLDVDKEGDILQLEMDARSGKGDIYLRYKPDPFGQMSFRLEASDAGATLKAMDLYPNVREGQILIEGTRPPRSHINDLDGIAQLTNFRVVDAPALARLMNAMSLNGLQQLLGGEGITFKKMKTNFKRKKKKSGTELSFKDGRTSGAEVGLTFEGFVNQDTGKVNVKGTVIPLSSLNKVVGQIPIVGQILTGGGALIAATYDMKREGKDKEIKVSVNPLSALTPGILRKILFEGDVKSED